MSPPCPSSLSISTAKMAHGLGLLFFLCGISHLITGTPAQDGTATKSDRCPAGWTQLNNRCFIYQNNAETFDQAEKSCNLLRGNLVSIHSDMELAVVNELTTLSLDAIAIWIGLSKTDLAGDVMWTDGSETEFAESQLAGSIDVGCIAIQTNDLVWDVTDCGTNLTYICGRDVLQCVSLCVAEAILSP
ncbi:snaclec purpureotin subunit beta-like isoform X1 [Hippocampus comes]|uniref:snaclec purpureotin subunit beta-like isoform X1 n=1 Tax=Hippocampus comes TaxID=109280 RepID=UPI00094E3A0E|nr:PREDICTED: snaclec purpureotin subunit beta-like isoform X1 [Hippocampus comes]